MLRDRGVIKWTAMMLPEHTQQLKEWEEALQQNPLPPPLTEWELTELQQKVEVAYAQKIPITMTLFINDEWHVETGLIDKIIFEKAFLLLTTEKRIYFNHIQGAELDDSYK